MEELEILDSNAYNLHTEMAKEMETRKEISEPVEILPEGIGTMPAMEAAPLLARASSRIQTLQWNDEFWDGVRQNLEGSAAWIKAEKANIVKKTLSAITGVSLLTSMVSACTNGSGPVIIPSETSPRTREVSPTATEVTPTSTETPTPTETATVTPEPDGVYSEVYTFADFEKRDITFEELPLIDYETLKADDLSTSVQVGDKVMEKALPVQKSGIGIDPNAASFTFETALDPNHFSYINDPETRPFKVVRAFRTEVNGKNFAGAIVLVKNSDGSVTKLKMLFSNDFALPANVKYLNEQLTSGPATDWAPIAISSGVYPAEMPMNLKGDPMNVTLGEFYVTPAELEEIKILMHQWQKTGIAPPELAKYIFNPIPGLWVP